MYYSIVLHFTCPFTSLHFYFSNNCYLTWVPFLSWNLFSMSEYNTPRLLQCHTHYFSWHAFFYMLLYIIIILVLSWVHFILDIGFICRIIIKIYCDTGTDSSCVFAHTSSSSSFSSMEKHPLPPALAGQQLATIATSMYICGVFFKPIYQL